MILFVTSCELFDPYGDTDAVIRSRMYDLNCPGMSVAVVTRNGIAWAKAYGDADKGGGKAVTTDTLFNIASVSKPITGILAMKCFEDKLFELDDPVNKYLPFNVSHPEYEDTEISIRMLMTHSSGIISNWPTIKRELYLPWDGKTRIYIGLEEYMREYLVEGGKYYSRKNFADFRPGTEEEYSNEGIALLAYIIELVTGMPFEEYCDRELIEPLDIEGAWFLADVNLDKAAKPYDVKTGDEIEFHEVPAWPAGSFIVSVEGFAKILTIMLNDGVSNGTRILKGSTVDLMLEKQTERHRLIWENATTTINGKSMLFHDGSIYGFRSFVYFNPSDKKGILAFGNSDFTPNFSSLEILKALDTKADEL